jgi:hypothetical protein
MKETAKFKQRSAAAERMRLTRARRTKGLRCISLDVRASEVENLIKLNILDPTHKNDPRAIAGALGRFLDRIPAWWWQPNMLLPPRQ